MNATTPHAVACTDAGAILTALADRIEAAEHDRCRLVATLTAVDGRPGDVAPDLADVAHLRRLAAALMGREAPHGQE